MKNLLCIMYKHLVAFFFNVSFCLHTLHVFCRYPICYVSFIKLTEKYISAFGKVLSYSVLFLYSTYKWITFSLNPLPILYHDTFMFSNIIMCEFVWLCYYLYNNMYVHAIINKPYKLLREPYEELLISYMSCIHSS